MSTSQLTVVEISKLDIAKFLILPDLKEFLLFLLAIFINFFLFGIIISSDIFLLSFNQMNTTTFGIILMIFYGYRWGYSSLGDAERKARDREKAHREGEMVIVNLKLFGLFFAFFFFFGGIFFFDFVYTLLIPIVGPIIEFIRISFF